MMQPKRLIVILLVVALALFGALAVSAADAPGLEITVDMGNDGATVVAPGDTVKVSVTIDSNPGLLAGTIKLQYDPTVMAPVLDGANVVYTKGENFAAATNVQFEVYPQASKNIVVIALMSKTIPNKFTTDGLVATVDFKVLETDTCGDASITLADVNTSFGVSNVVVHDANEEGYIGATAYFHNYGEVTSYGATCTQPAKTVQVCQNPDCGKVLEVPFGEALGHDYIADVTPPTCGSEGYTTYTCSRNCGEEGHTYVGDPTPTTSHEYTLVGEGEATCTDIGYKNYACINCDHTYTAVVAPATGHDYKYDVMPATCTTLGYTMVTCANCDYVAKENETAALGHNYVGVVTAPTCTAEGFTTFTCDRTDCGDSYVGDYRDMAPHAYGDWATVTAPTCETEGEAKRVCACGAVETKAIDDLGHAYVGVVTAPTCTEEGFTTFTCANCKDTYVGDYTDKAPHAYGEWETVTAPTCETEGEAKRVCACGAVETKAIDDLGHAYVGVVTAPTCTEEGFTTFTCANCKDTYVGDYTDKAAHTFGDWVEVTAPDCENEGEAKRECACGAVETKAIDDLGHTYTTKVTAATCTTFGYTTYTCACGDTFVADIVAATGHTYTKVDTAATCTTMGYTTYTCACGDKYVADYVDAKGHTYTSAVTAPTCTAMGYTTYTCSVEGCGVSYVADEKAALAHTYTKVETAATCTTMGYTTYTCACGDKYVADYVDAKGHTYTSAVTAPTCTTMGYTTYTCACGDTYKADYVDAKGHTVEIIPAVAPTYSKKGSTEGEKCSVCGTILTATKDVAEKSTAWIWILVIVCVVVIGGAVAGVIILKKKEMWFFKKK